MGKETLISYPTEKKKTNIVYKDKSASYSFTYRGV